MDLVEGVTAVELGLSTLSEEGQALCLSLVRLLTAAHEHGGLLALT